MAASDSERRAVEAEYERLSGDGPDFTLRLLGGTFEPAPHQKITREDRIQILRLFDAIRAGLYRHCRSQRGQVVSQNYRAVLGVLLSYAMRHGRTFPELKTIARAAMVSRSTVLRALDWLALFGLVNRIRRLKRRQTALGNWQTLQTSNAYKIAVGAGSLTRAAFAALRGDRLEVERCVAAHFRTECHNWYPYSQHRGLQIQKNTVAAS